jgi:hypothetical protein
VVTTGYRRGPNTDENRPDGLYGGSKMPNKEPRSIMQKWEYLVAPLKDSAGIKSSSQGVTPDGLNRLGAEGWEAVGVSLKRGDLVAWPVVLLKRPV